MQGDKQRAIVFDFDGTIADSFPIALEIFYALTHITPLQSEDMTRLRGMTLIQVAKELRIPMYLVPLLLIRGRSIMRKRMHEIEIIAGMDEAIRVLYKTHTLFILSSNSQRNITLMLSKYGLVDCFEEIHGSVPLLGKARRLHKILKHYGLNPAETWYVGDEARDIEAARKSHMKTAAVSWGYNNIHVLKQHQPDALVFTPDELLDCLKNNS